MTVDPLRDALAEAFTKACGCTLWDVDGPWFCENVPPRVWDRACEVVNR